MYIRYKIEPSFTQDGLNFQHAIKKESEKSDSLYCLGFNIVGELNIVQMANIPATQLKEVPMKLLCQGLDFIEVDRPALEVGDKEWMGFEIIQEAPIMINGVWKYKIKRNDN